MQSATSIADQAIAKMEAEENGIVTDDDKNKGTENEDNKGTDKKETPAEDDKADGKAAGKDGKPDAGAEDKEDEEDKPEEGKFTADDALEVEEKEENKPDAPTDAAGIQLSPAEQTHIRENIGEPLTIKGFQGDKEVEIKAFTPADIPADFKFASDAQMIAAQNGFQRLEQRAEKLLGEFRQNQTDTQARDFERRENEGIRADVADLQKEGRFPKFTVQPGAEGFDDSPEAKQMAEVLGIMTEKNDMYLKQYQQGRPYKHIGFAEAFDIWERNNPAKQSEKKRDAEQDAEDKARKGTADKIGNSGGAPQSNIMKPTIKSGTTIDDIMARVDAEDF